MAQTRSFRSQESYLAERVTRDMLPSYLEQRGFTEIDDHRQLYGKSESQTITARTSLGQRVSMRVRVCWRRDRDKPKTKTYSAAQLLARVDGTDWVGSIKKKIARQAREGVTHLLLVQRDGSEICHAAMIPLSEVLSIWEQQRDISADLVRRGKSGKKKKNHAMNGASPTLWLQDDFAPAVAQALWTHAGVTNLEHLAYTEVGSHHLTDDSFDDLPAIPVWELGADQPTRYTAIKSYVKRDPKVRTAVIVRAKGKCERSECGEQRDYPGFLDVHHILGAEKSDRVFNCVALCPNCHREAHYAPDYVELNAALLTIAMRSSA